jgi:hypothetical protein
MERPSISTTASRSSALTTTDPVSGESVAVVFTVWPATTLIWRGVAENPSRSK